MSHQKRRAVEMTVPWKAWKTKTRFSTLPTALGNRSAIPTFPQLRRRVLLSYAVNPRRPRGFAPDRYRVVVVGREK